MQTPDWDIALLRLINQDWRNPGLDWLMPFVSGEFFHVLLGAAVLIFLCRRHFRISGRGVAIAIAFCALVTLANDVLVDFVKQEAGRARPVHALPLVYGYNRAASVWTQTPAAYQPDNEEERDSFYSGHASAFMALSLALMLCFPPLRSWLWLAPLLVGYSRIYLGRHYPTDVLLGCLAGAVLVLICWLAWRRFSPRTFAWLTEAGEKLAGQGQK